MNDTLPPSADALPQPKRGDVGGTIAGPRNLPREQENPDLLVPPSTDSGTLPNLRFSFADAHMRLQPGGWTREVTVRELPISTDHGRGQHAPQSRQPQRCAGDALAPGGGVGLHAGRHGPHHRRRPGRSQLRRRRRRGRSLVLPGRHPALHPGPGDGCEFLLVFDDGNFSENSTFLLTDWFLHTPTSVLAKNFGVPEEEFAHIPSTSSTSSPRRRRDRSPPISFAGPNGAVPEPFSYRLSQQEPIQAAGGRVRIVDSRNFPAVQDDCRGVRRGRSRRHAGAALAPQCATSGSTTWKGRRA